MRMGMRQMRRPRRVASSDRAFLEMPLQDITSRESVLAENAHVGAIAGVCNSLAGLGSRRVRVSDTHA